MLHSVPQSWTNDKDSYSKASRRSDKSQDNVPLARGGVFYSGRFVKIDGGDIAHGKLDEPNKENIY